MIKIVEYKNNKININNNVNIDKDIKEKSWIHLTNPNIDLLNSLSNITKIDLELLLTSIDDEEIAHMDRSDDTNLIVVDIPFIENNIHTTVPFSILYNSKYYITVCSKEVDLIEKIILKNTIETNKHTRLTLQILYLISNSYIQSLRKIDDLTKKTEDILIKTMKNNEILELMYINKSLVHFSTSLNSNKMLLIKLRRSKDFIMYEDDYDLMEDLIIELDQAVEMCQIHRDILKSSMDSFNSMINNNVNDSMQVLAIITLAISFPTIIASIFGMNVDLPFDNYKYSFHLIIAISLILSIISGIIITKFARKKNNGKSL